jgi:hypothetical protein
VFRRKRADDGDPESRNPYEDMRAMALSAVVTGLAPPGTGHPDVSGVVVDVPAQGGFATFVALNDNTTSMYTSTGGGTIGAGEHQHVAAATQALLAAAQAHIEAFSPPDDARLPAGGMVRFHALGPSGGRYVDVPEDSFWGRSPHALMPVIAATQDVISAIQTV